MNCTCIFRYDIKSNGISLFFFFNLNSKWSHMPKAKTPSFANKIMKLGLTIDRSPHALHHTAPYEGNYCIVSGLCNKLLDSSGFFRKMEHMIYKINGIESNSWKLDPVLKEKTLGGVYKLNP